MSAASAWRALERRLSRGPWAEVALLAVALTTCGYGAAFHEPWRDEVQAMLVARTAAWSSLADTTHLEGATPTFHALLKVLGWALGSRAGLAVAGGIGSLSLLFGVRAVALVITRSRSRALLVALAFALTDTCSYELGVIVRPYGLALGLACFAFALLHRALVSESARLALWGGALAGLATATSTHIGCYAGGLVAAFALVSARRHRAWLSAGAAYLPGFALTLWCIRAHPARAEIASEAFVMPLSDALARALDVLERAVASPGFWLSADAREASRSALLPSAAGVSLAALVYVAHKPDRRKTVVLAVLGATLGALPLLYVLIYRYWGAYRHRVGLWTPLLVISLAWLLAPSRGDPRTRLLRALGLLALVPRFYFEARTLVVDASADARWLFSETGEVARSLPENAHAVALQDWSAVGVVFHRPDVQLRSGSGGGRIVVRLVPDRAWLTAVPILPIVRETCASAPSSTFVIVDRGRTSNVPAACLSPVPHRTTPAPTWIVNETLDVSRVDCACVAAAK